MDPQDFVMVIVGFVACFAGYSMFRGMLPLWGFILGGWISFIFFPSVFPQYGNELLFKGIAFVVGGIVGALISSPLYFVIVFLSGAVLGGVFGIIFGAIIDTGGISSINQLARITALSFPPVPHTATQFLFMAIFAVVMGGMALGFQQFMISASSAYVGAAAVISGATIPISQGIASPEGRGAVLMMAWLILGFIGMFIQYRMQDQT